MDLKSGNITSIYFKYLFAAFGSTIVSSIYTTVDIVAVGHYSGPNGTAALACINPIWSMFMSTGMLFGIGGSVVMSICRGKGKKKEGDRYFTAALIAAVSASLIITVAGMVFREPMLRMFGADDVLLPYTLDYMQWIFPVIPTFLMGQFLMAFIRNDNSPVLCTIAIISGGGFNIFGDIFFVFGLDMGISGAGLATAIGQVIAIVILCSYFFTKKCSLRLAMPQSFGRTLLKILRTGFAPFIVDISFGLSVMLFNNQIMRYGSATELACYGTVSNIAIMFQSLFYGVGQALQPIVSTNFGAKNYNRVKKVLHLSMITAVIMGVIFFIISESIPSLLLKFYMTVNDEVMTVGPRIMRIYALSFLLMGINVVAGYYLQSVMKTKASVAVSLLRGFVLCTILVFALPAIFGFGAIWWTMPITELLVAAAALTVIKKYSRFENVSLA